MQLAKYPLNLANYMDQNGNLTNDGITLVIRTIQDVQEKITAIGRTELSVIATAAIRDAKNQRQILDAIAQVRGVSVTVLSHTEEADFGVGTAYALMASMGNETPENAIFVDQGGASIQVINIRGGNELVVERFLGKIGTHLVADKVKSIFYAELGLHENQIFPFPRVAGRDSGVLHYLYSLIANLLQLKGEKPSDFLGNSTTAYGVARAHQFCVLPLANPNGDHFTINEVDAALFQLSQLGEKAIKERYPSVQKPLDDFATMLLTYTIMRNFGIDKIVVLPIPGSSLASAVKLLPHWTSASRYTQPYWTGVASSQFDSMHEPLNITTIVNAFRPEKRAQFSLCITCPLAFNK
ncbi:MAG: hypothetical protein BGO28_07185 [Alphaproteobacteria bacterium 43-37]|nr:MAG: hypothetical protein BGO28_07185 [Alphaproteobacteria bacterium 43-37]